MKTVNRFYLSAVINAFGSWLTFLAITLIIQSRYGAKYVAFVFLLQTIPAIIFSRSLANIIPAGWHERAFTWAQIFLAINSLVLVFWQNVYVICAHLLVASILRSVSSPVFNSLIGKWVAKDKLREVFTRLGALQAGTLALAPVIGVWLKMVSSSSALFAIDSGSFVISLMFLPELLGKPMGERSISFRWRSLFSELSPRPKGLPAQAIQALKVWFVFLTVGALLNAIEFPAFASSHFTEKQIGYALGAWGVGNLLAFVFPFTIRRTHSAVAYVAALGLFFIGFAWWIQVLAFLFAGTFYSNFSGSLRATMQSAIPAGQNAAPMWAYANQCTQTINLVAFGSVGWILSMLTVEWLEGILVLSGVFFIAITRRFQTELDKKHVEYISF